MNQTLVLFNLQRNAIGNGFPNIMYSFPESLLLKMSPLLHQSMCIFKAGLSRSYDGWAKYNKKVPDVSDSNQNVETTFNSKTQVYII